MGKQKIIFLDIDGTIYDQNGAIPASAREAIRIAQKNGHIVMLCSGRSEGEIAQSLKEVGFDGMVGGAGASVRFHGELQMHRPMKREWVTGLLDLFGKKNISCVLETNDGVFGTKDGIYHIQQLIIQRLAVNKSLPVDFLGKYEAVEDPYQITDVNKMLFFDAPYSFEQVEEMLQHRFTLVPNSVIQSDYSSGEISELGMSKAKGIQWFLEHNNLDRADTIAIGDGVNDREMIAFAGVGIAMGNAVASLKEQADYVTEDVGNDGLYKAFAQFSLL